MFRAMTTIDVRSTPAQAFDHIARQFFEHHSLWDPSVKSMTKTTEGPVSLGTAGVERRRFGFWPIVSHIRVAAFEPDRRFAFETTDGPMVEQVEWEILGRNGGSAVSVDIRLTPASTSMRALEGVMRPMIARNVRGNVARMKAALDRAAAG